jgi:hypothetical protein
MASGLPSSAHYLPVENAAGSSFSQVLFCKYNTHHSSLIIIRSTVSILNIILCSEYLTNKEK